ncbi:MAG: Uma2 family endonuclease [Planctomycetaceae bacterium]
MSTLIVAVFAERPIAPVWKSAHAPTIMAESGPAESRAHHVSAGCLLQPACGAKGNFMATSIAEPGVQVVPRLLTVADLAVLPDKLPSGPVKYELDEGRLIIMAPPGDSHGAVESNVVAQLKFQGEYKGHGKARTNVSVILQRNPDRVYVPDAAFISNRSLPLRKSPEGYLETIPELVVEVRSKNDSVPELHRKAAAYLQAGVQIVWILDPSSKSVTICSPDAAPLTLQEHDVLTAGSLIPDFRVGVAELFRE